MVIGEKIKKKIQLMNNGALGTYFKLIKKRESIKITENLQNDEYELRQEEMPDGIKMGSVIKNKIKLIRIYLVQFFH